MMQVCVAEWLSQLSRQMEEEVFRFSMFVQVVLCIVIVHVFDSSYPLPLFGSKSFVNSDSFEVHNQIICLPPTRPYRGVGKIGRQTWRVLQKRFRHQCASRFHWALTGP